MQLDFAVGHSRKWTMIYGKSRNADVIVTAYGQLSQLEEGHCRKKKWCDSDNYYRIQIIIIG